MQSNREVVIRRLPKLILDKRFYATKRMKIGDEGQIVIYGRIDNNDTIIKTIYVNNVDSILPKKDKRNA